MMSEKRFDYEFGNDGYYILDKEKIGEYDESFTDKMEYREYNIENSLSGDEVVGLLNEYQVKLEILEKIIPKELPIKCQRCKFFVAYRNFNYEKMTNDTITIYCDLLQNKETYDRDTGDVIWENGWLNECPLRKGGFYE